MTRVCPFCAVEKPVSEFHKDANRKLGIASHCKSCACARSNAWRAARLDEVREKDRQRYAANPEPKKRTSLARSRGLTDEQKQQNRERQKTYEASLSEGERRRRQDAKSERQRIRNHRRRGHFVEDVNPLVVLERDDGICGICGDDVDPMNFHVDHIVPFARGGEHSYANTQTAHPKCNLTKGARMSAVRS